MNTRLRPERSTLLKDSTSALSGDLGGNDELMQSLDYKLATSSVNYVQSRRDVQYFPRPPAGWPASR